MNLRELLRKGLAVVPATAIVPAAALCQETCRARLVLITYAAPVGVPMSMPIVEAAIALHVAKGRRVVQVLENGHDLTRVVVEEEAADMQAATARLAEMNRLVVEDYEAAAREFGQVEAAALVGPGQVLDVLAFVRWHEERAIARLERRIGLLEQALGQRNEGLGLEG